MLRNFHLPTIRHLPQARARCQCGIPNKCSSTTFLTHPGSSTYKTSAYPSGISGFERSRAYHSFNHITKTIYQAAPLVSLRSRRNFSDKGDTASTSTNRSPARTANPNPSTPTHKEDWKIIRHLLPNIWPKDDRTTKIRVVTALLLLAGGKVYRYPSCLNTLSTLSRFLSTPIRFKVLGPW
ncbi:hypothetical protein PtA15_18A194 [Puccinia triticina]|uniref:Uncharacterized protein n=1 Tax=Puccinia triticina TaxID=208348 RepID=A0ABY7D6Y6_9BASI|nr:uncharacterized protein PtA15_18A194 [Puccinia triticina]WAQ93136.1 hypothetical protein PtA15_18A194 [Puccinia triticina]